MQPTNVVSIYNWNVLDDFLHSYNCSLKLTIVVVVVVADPNELLMTNRSYITLSGLLKFTNYTFTVAAFTAAGRGILSAPVVVATLEDGWKSILNRI